MIHFFILFILLAIDRPKGAAAQKSPELEKTIVHASDLLRAGEYRRAEPVFRELLSLSMNQGTDYYAARARVGLSVCYMLSHNLKAAVENGEIALRYGITAKNADIAVRAAINLSNVYRRMGNVASATQTLRKVNPFLSEITDLALNSQIYLHLATEAARQRDWARAEPFFFEGIEAALRNGDTQAAATGWNHLGYMRLLSNDLPNAETALTEAFRLRRLSGNRNLGTSYLYLGILRLAQGDAASALNLLNRAVHLGWNGEAPQRLTMVYYRRAKAKLNLSDVAGALADFDQAITLATQWRVDVLPADEDRINFEVGFDRIYDDYLSAGMTEWLKTRDPALARRMFEVSEQHKSVSFREKLTSRKALPVEYWGALADYRTALTSAWRLGESSTTSEAKLELAGLEARLGLEQAPEGLLQLADVQRALGPEEALLSFFTSKTQSWVWGVTRSSFEAYALPGRNEFAPIAKRYRDSIEMGTASEGTDTRLYEMLLLKLSSGVQAKKDWLLSLDEGLYDLPFATFGSAKAPLVLHHSLRTVFGAGLLGRPTKPVTSSRLVAAGDAIYNLADPRWTGPHPSNTTEFARLINTRHEIQEVAEAWTPDKSPLLLMGNTFNRETLDRELSQPLGVLHIAAHVVRHRTDKQEVMIGIGLGRDGTPDFLTSSDVAAKSVRIGLVTLNGCSSGGGADLPGAGLIGLTRSWLVAGASAVAATYWPVSDDRGDLFGTMYSKIVADGNPAITPLMAARALRMAQLEAWRSGGEQASSRQWAAVFLSSRN